MLSGWNILAFVLANKLFRLAKLPVWCVNSLDKHQNYEVHSYFTCLFSHSHLRFIWTFPQSFAKWACFSHTWSGLGAVGWWCQHWKILDWKLKFVVLECHNSCCLWLGLEKPPADELTVLNWNRTGVINSLSITAISQVGKCANVKSIQIQVNQTLWLTIHHAKTQCLWALCHAVLRTDCHMEWPEQHAQSHVPSPDLAAHLGLSNPVTPLQVRSTQGSINHVAFPWQQWLNKDLQTEPQQWFCPNIGWIFRS